MYAGYLTLNRSYFGSYWYSVLLKTKYRTKSIMYSSCSMHKQMNGSCYSVWNRASLSTINSSRSYRGSTVRRGYVTLRRSYSDVTITNIYPKSIMPTSSKVVISYAMLPRHVYSVSLKRSFRSNLSINSLLPWHKSNVPTSSLYHNGISSLCSSYLITALFESLNRLINEIYRHTERSLTLTKSIMPTSNGISSLIKSSYMEIGSIVVVDKSIKLKLMNSLLSVSNIAINSTSDSNKINSSISDRESESLINSLLLKNYIISNNCYSRSGYSLIDFYELSLHQTIRWIKLVMLLKSFHYIYNNRTTYSKVVHSYITKSIMYSSCSGLPAERSLTLFSKVGKLPSSNSVLVRSISRSYSTNRLISTDTVYMDLFKKLMIDNLYDGKYYKIDDICNIVEVIKLCTYKFCYLTLDNTNMIVSTSSRPDSAIIKSLIEILIMEIKKGSYFSNRCYSCYEKSYYEDFQILMSESQQYILVDCSKSYKHISRSRVNDKLCLLLRNDAEIVKLISSILDLPIYDSQSKDISHPTGLPPLNNLKEILFNIYLDDLDRNIQYKHPELQFVRYSSDIYIPVDKKSSFQKYKSIIQNMLIECDLHSSIVECYDKNVLKSEELKESEVE